MKCFNGYYKGMFMSALGIDNNDLRRRIGESFMERNASIIAYLASILSVMSLQDVGTIVGIITAVVTCCANIYFKYREMKHKERYGKYESDCDRRGSGIKSARSSNDTKL